MSDASPGLDRLSSINVDGSRRHIYPADVKGRFLTARRLTYLVLIALYLALPFFHIGGHPAVQLDIAARRFYLFGSVFNAQDTFRLVFLLLAGGFGLLFVTATYGRVWCGWACPQTVFLEGVYRYIERLLEGPREARLRLDRGAWTAGKVARKLVKHAAFVVVSLLLAHVFIAFFVSLPAVFEMVRQDPRSNWTAFVWVMAIAGALYFNFAWFREQLCIVICPYGRLQSVLMDRDSVVIGYDRTRGEPRGKSTRADREGLSLPVVKKGDCVDCGRCVVVCPTGIDIREGSQLECIGCAQCIDACDEVMTRLGRPKGLVRYDSENGLAGGPRRVLRPRVLVYGALFAVAATALVLVTTLRQPFEANLLRVQGAPYVLDHDGIRNQYELHLVNKNATASLLRVKIESPVPMELTLPEHEIRLEPLQGYRLPIMATVQRSDWKGPFELEIEVEDGASGIERKVTARFLGPQH